MEGLGQYILSVTATALACGILCGILEDGFAKELIKLLCGLAMALAVIRPAMDIDLTEVSDFLLQHRNEAAYVSAAGETMAEEAMADIIKQETEAYILDKAAALHAALSVDVTVENRIPAAVYLKGNASPYAKARLEAILEQDLGITKENQRWT